jgi:uncharacterized protein YggU (UPF0235/DUF167 family)
MLEKAHARALPPWLRKGEAFVDVQVVAKPGASRRGILRREARGLVIALNSRPSNGRANDELLEFLADLIGTPRSTISILRGHTGRVKTVRIEAREPARIAAVLQAYS